MWWVIGGIGAAFLIYSLTARSQYVFRDAVPMPGIDRAGHARRTSEGYVLSGIIGIDNVPAIQRAGIKLILSAVELDADIVEALNQAGIRDVVVPLGGRWDHGAEIRYWASQYPPEQILIHCYHGIDRTGNIMAHLLITRHGWDTADAFYAVVYPEQDQVEALADILADFGIDDRRTPSGTGVGVYSLRPLGLRGGMKAAGDFGAMIRGNLEEISSL